MFHSPFDQLGPDPIAREAAEQLKTTLPPLSEGKMLGVLVAENRRGERTTLRAFSGMLDGKWDHEGYAPPLFDRALRAAREPPGEAAVKRLHALYEQQLQEVERWARAKATQKQHHAERRARRHAEREQGPSHALDQQSRGDKAERRALEAGEHKAQRRLASLKRLRQLVSRSVMAQLHDTYVIPNARGETRPLRALYGPAGEPSLSNSPGDSPPARALSNPPSGAADCAAPKLLAEAYRRSLKPIALAEFWWGPPPLGGGRVQGEYYPACRDKCGPLLPFMLEGLDVAPPRRFTVPARRIDLRILHEEELFLIVDKPHGVLSIPGKEQPCSVLEEIKQRYPQALMVHRLDLDTSGLLVIALDARTHANLQAQFTRRTVHKRYVAWLDGEIGLQRGVIDLPLRVDVQDRPRQIHDPVHGKRALTSWETLDRRDRRTRVALFPHTGRTHQLRVHAAHPLGIGAPIVGDRLYGRDGERLLLHAETLEFERPLSQERVRFTSPAPF